ncbi:hypothetical protein NAPIS_ORF01898 [Vairimorpha apis BRL 01]|uniref:Uncharacterized protein n=1 Tax=Vairimorpha apis BRL 01 TaxID=1037528 RepID=T0L7P6_9MICR|nr:hypothetical protein NAPIS_ORF01898 [Vairimorpha apis BRL 01]
MTPLECIPENMCIEWVNDRTKFYDVCIRNMEFISSKIVFRDCLVDDVVGEIIKCKEGVVNRECYNEGCIEDENDGEEENGNEMVDEEENDGDNELVNSYCGNIDGNEKGDEGINENDGNQNEMVDEVNDGNENERVDSFDLLNEKYIGINDRLNNNIFENTTTNRITENTTTNKITETNSYSTNEKYKNISNKDSRTLRKTLNQNKILLNDTISDCSKISSNIFSSDNKDNEFNNIEIMFSNNNNINEGNNILIMDNSLNVKEEYNYNKRMFSNNNVKEFNNIKIVENSNNKDNEGNNIKRMESNNNSINEFNNIKRMDENINIKSCFEDYNRNIKQYSDKDNIKINKQESTSLKDKNRKLFIEEEFDSSSDDLLIDF